MLVARREGTLVRCATTVPGWPAGSPALAPTATASAAAAMLGGGSLLAHLLYACLQVEALCEGGGVCTGTWPAQHLQEQVPQLLCNRRAGQHGCVQLEQQRPEGGDGVEALQRAVDVAGVAQVVEAAGGPILPGGGGIQGAGANTGGWVGWQGGGGGRPVGSQDQQGYQLGVRCMWCENWWPEVRLLSCMLAMSAVLGLQTSLLWLPDGKLL